MSRVQDTEEREESKSKLTILDLRRADFDLSSSKTDLMLLTK